MISEHNVEFHYHHFYNISAPRKETPGLHLLIPSVQDMRVLDFTEPRTQRTPEAFFFF